MEYDAGSSEDESVVDSEEAEDSEEYSEEEEEEEEGLSWDELEEEAKRYFVRFVEDYAAFAKPSSKMQSSMAKSRCSRHLYKFALSGAVYLIHTNLCQQISLEPFAADQYVSSVGTTRTSTLMKTMRKMTGVNENGLAVEGEQSRSAATDRASQPFIFTSRP